MVGSPAVGSLVGPVTFLLDQLKLRIPAIQLFNREFSERAVIRSHARIDVIVIDSPL